MSIEKLNLQFKNLPIKKTLDLDGFVGESSQTSKKSIIPN